VAELERRLGDQLALSEDTERRAERAEFAIVDVEKQLCQSQQDALEQHQRVQQQLATDHRQVRPFYRDRPVFIGTVPPFTRHLKTTILRLLAHTACFVFFYKVKLIK